MSLCELVKHHADPATGEARADGVIRGLAAERGVTFEAARRLVYQAEGAGQVVITPRYTLALP